MIDATQAIEELGKLTKGSRRGDALARLDVLRERHDDQVLARLRKIYTDKEVTAGMARWVPDMFKLVNPAKDIVQQIACAYMLPVWRALDAEQPAERERLQRVWNLVHEDCRTTLKAREINAFAYGVGPTAAIPVVRGERVRLEYFAPHRWMPLLDPDDHEGPLLGAVIDLAQGRQATEPSYEPNAPAKRGKPTIVIIDREAWRYYDEKGAEVKGPAGLHAIQHGCVDATGDPLCPVTIARVDLPLDDNWWTSGRGSRLFAATVLGAVVLARMMFVRQYQDSAVLLSRLGTQTDVEEEAVIGHPAKPMVFRGEDVARAGVEMVNFATSPDDHLRVLNFIISSAALGEGFPPEAITISTPLDVGKMGGSRLPSVSIKEGHRAILRLGQIEHFREWERDLAVAIVSTARGAGLDVAEQLPPIDEIRERTQVEWAQLDTIDDPAKRREQDQWEIERGLSSRVDIYRRTHPELTREQALEDLKRNANEDGEIHQILAARNQPRDPRAQGLEPPGSSLTPAQANGALGPIIRDQQREQPT